MASSAPSAAQAKRDAAREARLWFMRRLVKATGWVAPEQRVPWRCGVCHGAEYWQRQPADPERVCTRCHGGVAQARKRLEELPVGTLL
mgnify:CR=1 FL=1